MSPCLLSYSDCNRANVLSGFDEEKILMPKRKQTSRRKRKIRRRPGSRRVRRLGGKRSKVRIVNGRVAIRLAGIPGVQYIPSSHIVSHIGVTHVKRAAKLAVNKLRKVKTKSRKRRGTIRKKRTGRRKQRS